MRGAVHKLKLTGMRQRSGPEAGKPIRDAEGRFVQSPSHPPQNVPTTTVKGRIGFPSRQEVEEGEDIDNAAQLPVGTVVRRGDELEAVGTGNPLLDGRYEIVGVSYGRAMVRVTLKRFSL